MAVVVKINEHGERSYKSAKHGVLSDEEMTKADRLNDMLEEKIDDFVNEHDLHEISKNRVHQYWEFGKMLRDVCESPENVQSEEKEFFFQNARIHMDKYNKVFPSNDRKRRRNIPKQLYKLSSYPYKVAKLVEWSQWSFLFDNTYLIQNTGFDDWFAKILASGNYKFNESFTRLWTESFNLLFRKVDLSDWTKDEFNRTLTCTLEIIQNVVEEDIKTDSREVRRSIKKCIVDVLKASRKEFILMQIGQLGQDEYISSVSSKIMQQYKATNTAK